MNNRRSSSLAGVDAALSDKLNGIRLSDFSSPVHYFILASNLVLDGN